MPNSTAALHERAARLAANPSIRPHGLENTYTNWMCRCPECTAAHTEYRKAQRSQQVQRDLDDLPDPTRATRVAHARKMGWDVNDDGADVI